jgi:hypothetical protein
MSDKTPLERDIERFEMFRIPVSIKIVIVLLIVGLTITGLHAVNLQRKLSDKNEETMFIKNTLQKEKLELIGEIKRLKAEAEAAAINQANITENNVLDSQPQS